MVGVVLGVVAGGVVALVVDGDDVVAEVVGLTVVGVVNAWDVVSAGVVAGVVAGVPDEQLKPTRTTVSKPSDNTVLFNAVPGNLRLNPCFCMISSFFQTCQVRRSPLSSCFLV